MSCVDLPLPDLKPMDGVCLPVQASQGPARGPAAERRAGGASLTRLDRQARNQPWDLRAGGILEGCAPWGAPMGFFRLEPMSPARLVAGFVVAPLWAGVIVVALLGWWSAPGLSLVALALVYAPALVLGGPLCIAFRRRIPSRPLLTMFAAALVAITPWTAASLVALQAGSVLAAGASDWLFAGAISTGALLGLVGAAGGGLFWLLVAWRPRRTA